MKSIIRLFKAVPIASKVWKEQKDFSNVLLKATIEKGFIFTPEVAYNYSEKQLLEIIKLVETEVGLTGAQMNSSFHKSWAKVKDSTMFQLVIEQIIHYITTYGFEYLGIYNKNTVYIPDEQLKIPELKDGITLTVIKGYTKPELKSKLLDLLNTGIALGEDTIKDVVDVALFTEVNETEIEQVRNKETKAILYDYLGKVPENPIEFLRFMVYKSTDKTLLIKNKSTFEEIKSKKNINVLRYFIQYRQKHGLEPLAQIFFRFKPLFLAFKTNSGMKPIINRIRKLADVHHVPMKEDYLNSITAKITKGELIDGEELKKELAKVNTFRKVRLAYALNYRTNDVDSILYKIRNGKGYAKDFSFDDKDSAKEILDRIVMHSIIDDVKRNVNGKKIYIPENIVYALPTTEKQFTGDFPSGTYITMPKDMIFGVHWDNIDDHRIDLDLSLISPTSGKIGWDVSYRTEERDIMFSGDLTDAPAPNGASELFYVSKQSNSIAIMLVNYYNYDEDVEVPFKILVARKGSAGFKQHYMVNPNELLCVAKSKINQKQKILGIAVALPKECRFYFSEVNIGRSITSSNNKYTEQSRKYLYNFYTNAISLNEVLRLAGAEMVADKADADIDLSPETLEKDKIINLLR